MENHQNQLDIGQDDFQYELCLSKLMPIRDTLDVINGKWKILILVSVMSGTKRFKEIERSVPGITSKVLAQELRDLEANKLIDRKVYDEYPVRIEYVATDYANTLKKLFHELHEWGVKHRKQIMQ